MLVFSVLCGFPVAGSQAQVTYCAASGGCDEYISMVSVGTINNPSSCGGYQDFTTLSTIMAPGMSYPITVSNGNPIYPDDQCGIWVDWNQNGNFYDDPPIAVLGSPGVGPYTAVITPPFTALPGQTRMRVRILYTGIVDPCGNTSYGEVEDYTIIVPSLNAVDAGMVAINEPLNPNSPGFQDIKATFMNFGTQTLTSVTLNWSVDGVAGTPYAWTGNLASLASAGPVTIGNVNLPVGVHSIKVWTSSPNGINDPFTLNDTLQITVNTCNLLSGTYTIGASGANYSSISAAVSAVSSCGIGGPVTFNILPGTYNEQVLIPPIPGSSSMNSITFQSSTGIPSDVIIAYSAQTDQSNYTIKLDGADYININNMTIKADGPIYAYAIVLTNGASYNYIQGNNIQSNATASMDYSSAGIYSGNTIDEGNIIAGNTIAHGYYGIFLSGDWMASEQNNIVEGNNIYGFYSYGIEAINQAFLSVRYNQIHNGPYNAWMTGIYLDNISIALTASSNRIKMQGAGGFTGMSISGSDLSDTLRGLIANNFVSVQTTHQDATGILLSNSQHCDLVYNSVRTASQSTYSAAFSVSNWSGYGDNRVLNNLFTNFGGGYAVRFDWGAAGSLSLMDYNDLYTNGNFLGYNNIDIANLAAWVTQTGLDSNSVSANPNFATNMDLYPSSAAINNLGTPFAAVFDDIDGSIRDAVSPDMGAVEFTPPSTDMAVIEWVSPGGSSCGLGTSQFVTIKVYNNGLNAQSGFSLKYSIDGGQTFSLPEVAPGILASGDTLVHTFAQSANMSAVGVYSCVAVVSQAGDLNALNDTLKGHIVRNLCTINSFPFIENFGGGLTHYFDLSAGPNAGITVSNQVGNPSPGLFMTGGFTSNWSGWSTTTTPYEAWVLNTWHQSQAMTCQVNAAGVSNLKLSLDLRMTYSYGPMYSYFRVVVNDTIQLTDLNGQTDFNPVTQSSDPFQTLEFDLSPYTGSTFTLKLQAALNYTGSGSSLSDNAYVDNVKLYVPVPNDVGVVGVINPVDSSCSGGNTQVVLVLRNHGTVAQTSFPVHVQVTGPNSLVQTLSYNYIGNLPPNGKDTILAGTLSTAISGAYQMTAYTAMSNDQAAYNDTLRSSFYAIAPVDTFPYLEDFETFTYVPWDQGIFENGWTSASISVYGFEMYVGQGMTSSSFTGPAGDHTSGNGMYIFSEASNGDMGDQAMLISPCLDLGSLSAPELRFWYHMYGSAIGALHVDVLQGGVWIPSIFTISGQQQTNTGDPWREAVVSLNSYQALDKIRFRVVRGGSYEGDVSIDDVIIRQAPAQEAHLVAIPSPNSGCDMGLETVSVKIWNRGADTITGNCTVSYRLGNSSAVVTEPMTTLILPGDTGTHIFSGSVNLSVSKDSLFSFKAWVSLTGDTWNSNDTLVKQVSSRVSPPDPMVNNTTVYHGQSATLAVLNPDTAQSYFWYTSPTAPTPAGMGITHQTGPLTSTTVYWVEGMYGSGFQTVTIGPGMYATPYVPTYGYYDYSWSASLFSLGELGGSGQIDSIAYYLDAPVNYPMLGQKIWMGHSTDSVFLNDDKPDPALLTQVFNGNITWTGQGWFSIPLDTPFMYNGVHHLMIYWENWDGSWVSGYPFFRTTPTSQYQAKYNFADMSFPAYSGNLTYDRADIRLTGSGNGCPSNRMADTVFVIMPVVFVNAGQDAAICQGDTLQMQVVATGGLTPYSYTWSPAISLSNASIPNPLAFPMVNTTYSVTVTDQNSDSGTDDIIVTVKPLPNVTFTPVPGVLINTLPFPLTTGSPAGGTYAGPGVAGGVFNPAAAGGGTHTLTYSYTNPSTGCTGTATAQQYVNPLPGIEESGIAEGLSIFPNPGSGMIFLSFSNPIEAMNLDILDARGRILLEEARIIIKDLHPLDVSSLPPGVYTLRLTGEEIQYAVKLIIR